MGTAGLGFKGRLQNRPPPTSTDDSPSRKTGARVTSGSLWKTLGLAWCWKWRKFHQRAEKPCRGGSQGEGLGSTHVPQWPPTSPSAAP